MLLVNGVDNLREIKKIKIKSLTVLCVGLVGN